MLAGQHDLLHDPGAREQDLAVEGDLRARFRTRDPEPYELRIEQLAIGRALAVEARSPQGGGAVSEAFLEILSRLDGLVEIDQ